MYCLKCGREIPEGSFFCPDCARKEQAGSTQYFTPPTQSAIRNASQNAPRPEPRPEPRPDPRPEPEPQRRMNPLLIPLIAVAVFFVAACVLTFSMYRTMTVQRNNYRVKEADLSLRESELTGIRESYADAKKELDTANQKLEDQRAEIASLREELVSKESTASQDRYDAEAAQKSIELLTQEKNELADQNEELTEDLAKAGEELEKQLEAVRSAQDELDEMKTKYKDAKEKADFMDTYVVFVNNNGSNLYHTFTCKQFVKSNFWAYSRKLAENYGYSACPECCR